MRQTRPFDAMGPFDVQLFEVDFSGLLGAGEQIVSLDGVTVDATSAGLGVEIGSGVRAPSIVGGRTVRFWLSVAPAQQADVAYVNGIEARVSIRFVTDSVPSRTIQRTVRCIIRNR